jgi:hypothetical protein
MAKKSRKSASGNKIAAGVIITALIMLGLGIAAGMRLAPNHDVLVRITVSSDFGVTWLGHLNETDNCSMLEIDAYVFSPNVYNAINDYFAANATGHWLGMSNITNVTDFSGTFTVLDTYATMGNASLLFWGWTTNETKLDGLSATFNFGSGFAVIDLDIATYLNGAHEDDDFMANATMQMMDDLYVGNLTATVWHAATLFTGYDDLTINYWNYDQYTLGVTLNGVATTWGED